MKYGEVNLKEMTLEEWKAHSLSMPENTILRPQVEKISQARYGWVLYGFPVGGKFDENSKPVAQSPGPGWSTEQEARQAYLDVQGAIVLNRLRDEMAWQEAKRQKETNKCSKQ